MALGAYVHIPFCASRCDYCAFATWTDRAHLMNDYVDAVVDHIRATLGAAEFPPLSSLFFGGGTPSLIPPDDLVRIVAALPLGPGAEVTVECNPDTVTDDLLATYREGGVNRISIGVQSMVPHVLTSLGRTHDIDAVERCVVAIREAGFTTFNIDLIYGAAGESVADWRQTLGAIVDLDPPHVSAYGLTVEAGTPLALDDARHPDDDDQADKYLLATEGFAELGLEWYEISNWARPGHECRHNLLYWDQGDYLAFGCAAHGHLDGTRWWTVRTPERYIEAVRSGGSAEGGREVLDPDVRAREALQLSLRTRDGVPVSALAADDPALVDLIKVDGERSRLTVAGRLLANEVAMRLQ